MQSGNQFITPQRRFRSDMINEVLHRLHLSVAGIQASVVVNPDGLLVAAYPSNDEDALLGGSSTSQVAAMSATLLSLAERTLVHLEQGHLRRLLMEGETGVMMIYPAGRATLAVLAGNDVLVSRLLFSVRQATKEIKAVLGE
jgi:predicted regulator of Ras-like GTPase activity (Roadblock/LC7/MglB family)